MKSFNSRLTVVAAVWLLVTPGCGPRAADETAEARQGTIVNVAQPGAPPMPAGTAGAIGEAWLARNPQYKPRTRHLEPDGAPKYTNRLFLETSPYLRQHAHNPVNWYPWGDEAFATAKKLGRPVLLSVGYSTCHWCHVMEEESFEDEAIARFMNENYIAVKVDREERPDVDSIYMSAVQSLTGRGGWPMTVWLTPDRKPYYGGTYFPARDGDRGARAGFLTLLTNLKQVYDTQPTEVAERAEEITRALRQRLSSAVGSAPDIAVIRSAIDAVHASYDPNHGGRRGAPKFPSSFPVRFALRHYRRTGAEGSLNMARRTLEKMAGGGMYDHAGGGFHRYSTDAMWLVPHFEKMLYDNALLTLDYLEGYQVTGDEDFARVVREILRYAERDMTSPEGAFYSATDADSLTPAGHREEGWFFTWTPAEIVAALGEQRAKIVNAYYGVTEKGNFEGRNILNTPRSAGEVARELEIPESKLRATVEQAKDVLYRVRAERPAPLRDEKILVAWNGLMISALARSGFVLSNASYVERADRAASFILDKMRLEGRLMRSYKDGRTRHAAYLDDYAFLIAGLLDLYEAGGRVRWLEEARALDRVLAEHYEDREHGGFFLTASDAEVLLTREKPAYDGALPTGNSVHALNLLRLAKFTDEDAYRQRADRSMKAVGRVLARAPMALSEMLLALDFKLDRPKEVIVVTPGSRGRAEPLLAELRKAFVPNRILVVAVEGSDLAAQEKAVPLVQRKTAIKKKPTAYVCENGVCKLPTSDPAVFARQIAKVEPLAEPEVPAEAASAGD